ncbi:MAG: nucleotidyltransferase domain-containing protein [Deltaproteobacteria bacterium]|jgi:predicted nucleotidyltransferase|nr:nucleotidyltransferase domain-containing protein [Deltaproteobacteria bacterium]
MDLIEKNVLDSFLTLMREKIKVDRVVLFGSRARGDADLDSDMDVLVIVNDFTDRTEDFISQCAWEAGFENDIILVPVVFSRDDWENGPERYSLLAEAIKSEGVYLL